MAWTMRASFVGCLTSAKWSISFLSFPRKRESGFFEDKLDARLRGHDNRVAKSKLLQQPVDVIQLLLRTAAFAGAFAQLLQNAARPGQVAGARQLDAIGTRIAAAKRIFLAVLLAIFLGLLLRQRIGALAQGVERVLFFIA